MLTEMSAPLFDALGFVVHVFHLGGPVMYVLAAMLIWCVTIIILKTNQLRRSKVIRIQAVETIERLLIEGRLPEATAYCKKNLTPMTRIMLAGILHFDRSEAEIKERLEEAGRQEFPWIRKHLTTLRTLASASPLVGLFGTVIGMIRVFNALSQGSNIEPSQLAGGISEALVATAFGLATAIPAIVFYNDFSNRVTKLLIEMEKISLHMVAILKRNR